MKSLEDAMLQLALRSRGSAGGCLDGQSLDRMVPGERLYAHASLGRALEAAPGYRLAELLSEVVRRGTICGWAARREAAWQKFGTDAA